MNRPIWFKAKAYGWGWYPSTWQGWTVILVYFVAIGLIFNFFNIGTNVNSDTSTMATILFLILTVILVIVSYLFGEKPGWRWGKK